jgi:hypothetical protein
MSRASHDDPPVLPGEPRTPRPPPNLLRPIAWFLLVENLALLGLVAALAMLPTGSGTPFSTASTHASSEATPGSAAAIAGQMSVPVFDQETLALEDYLGRLDRLVDIKTVLARRPDLNEIASKRNAAYGCARFACPALDEWVVLVRSMGRHIPNPPHWAGSGAELAESMAVSDYIEILTEKIDQAERLSGRSDLMPPSDTLEAARGCQRTNCPELGALIEQAAASLASVGETVPPLPPEVGAGPPNGSPGEKSARKGRKSVGQHQGGLPRGGKSGRRSSGGRSPDDDAF